MADTKADKLENEPELKRSYAGHFAVLVLLLLISLAWAVWDETIGRRPWKLSQAEFGGLESYLLQEELDDVNAANLLPARKAERDKVESAYLAAQTAYDANPKVLELNEKLETLQGKVWIAMRDFRAARGKLQEAEYWAEKEGGASHTRAVAQLSPAVDRYRDVLDTLSEEENELQVLLVSLSADKDLYEEKLRGLKDKVSGLERLLAASKRRGSKIHQIFIPEIGVIDRCESCHLGIRNKRFKNASQPFSAHPEVFSVRAGYDGPPKWKGILDVHNPDRFGCTTCHRGQGYATTSPEKAHGEVEFWLKPMLRGEFAQASCAKCHDDLENLPGAPLLSRGRELFEKSGCYNCHIIKGYENKRKIGPSLEGVGRKVNRKWLKAWVKNPREYLPNSTMPDFFLSDEEVEHVASFVLSLDTEKSNSKIKWPSWASKPFEELDDDEFDEMDKLALKGKGIWGQARCSICHPRGGVGGETGLAPDLGRIVTKTNRSRIFRRIRNPLLVNPNSEMPHFRFSNEDLLALVEFIVRDEKFGTPDEGTYPALQAEFARPPADAASVEEGRRIVTNYQCSGCHSIPGFPENEKLCVDLSQHGSKPIEELDFARLEEKIPHTRAAFFMGKLSTPRDFRDGLKMPRYEFSEEDIKAVTIFLMSLTDDDVPEKFRVRAPSDDYEPPGEFGQIVADINCFACHRIHGRGGTFAPDLSIEGSVVTRRWLNEFLKKPDVLRPMLQQMPNFNFTEGEAAVLTEHIKVALVDSKIHHDFLPDEIGPADAAEGKALYASKGCRACHQIGVEGGAVAPLLTEVGDRLEAGYIFQYLKAPHAFRPDAAEPNLGLSDEEALSLTKFMKSLRKETSE